MWIYKRPDSDVWWIGYRLNGRQYRRSTKETNRAEAEKMAEKMGMMESAKRTGTLTDEFYALLTGNATKAVPLKAAVDGWLAECQGANAAGTVREYRTITDAFQTFVKASDTAPALGEISTEDVLGFLTDYRKTRSASTVNKARKILSVFFMREMKLGRLKANPVVAVKMFKSGTLEKSSRRAFTLEEIKSMFGKAPDDFWRFAVVAGFYTGLRLGDLICLRWGAVDFSGGFIRTMMIKTRKPVAIPMAAPVHAMLRTRHSVVENPKPTDFVWPAEAKLYQKRGAGPFSAQFFAEVLLPLGLVTPRDYHTKDGPGRAGKRQTPGVSFHCLRHSFVTALKLSGGSQSIAKELAEHGSDMVSNLYTHLPEAALTEAIKALPEVT